MIHRKTIATAGAFAAAAALAGCSGFVTRNAYDPDIAGLQDADQRLARDLESLRTQLASLRTDMYARLDEFDGEVAQLEKSVGSVRYDTTAHFAYDDATLKDQDKAALQDFAETVAEHEPNVMVTVEGFADPAGPEDYNKELARQRAEAVREYLVGSAGLSADRVRAISYGEDPSRQVQPGAWGRSGQSNRRATLVVEYLTASGTQAGSS